VEQRLFLHGAQLVLRSSVLIDTSLLEVYVTLLRSKSMLSGEGGSANGGWRCYWSPLLATKNPLPYLLVCCCFVVAEVVGAASTASGRF
jgi:hypothetical protein